MDIAVIGMLLLQEIATIDRQDLFPQLGDGWHVTISVWQTGRSDEMCSNFDDLPVW